MVRHIHIFKLSFFYPVVTEPMWIFLHSMVKSCVRANKLFLCVRVLPA